MSTPPPAAFPPPGLARTGALAAGASLALNLLWIVAMAMVGGEATAEVLAARPVWFRVNFASALLVALVQVPLTVALVGAAWRTGPVAALVGGITTLLYVPLNASAYYLNAAVLPELHRSVEPGAELLASAVAVGDPLGVVGALPAFGYGLLGLGWVVLSGPLWQRGDRRWRIAAGLLGLSGLLAVAGVAGVVAGVPALGLGVLVSGGVSVLAYAALIPALARGG